MAHVWSLASPGVDACETWREWAGAFAPIAWDGRVVGPSRRHARDVQHAPYTLGVVTFSEALDTVAEYLRAGAVSPWWVAIMRVESRVADAVHEGRTLTHGKRAAPTGRWVGGRWMPRPCEDPYGTVEAAHRDGRTHCRGAAHAVFLARRALLGLWVPADVHDAVTDAASRARDPEAPVLVSRDHLLTMRGLTPCWECDGRGQTVSGPCGACGGGGVEQ